MELKGPARVRMLHVLLLFGNVATVVTQPGDDNNTGLNLDCTNDYEERMYCDLEAVNCSEYSLTLRNDDDYIYKEYHCAFNLCENGRCCCSIKMTFIYGDTFEAMVFRGNKTVESKSIYVINSIKPIAPTIVSVEESNGNFQVKWRDTKMEVFSESLTYTITYHKKGDREKKGIDSVRPTITNGLKIYEIPGLNLEPSTTYVVSLKSQTSWNDRFSDSSKEREFTTRASPNVLVFAIIIGLSIAAVLISSAMFGCYVELKAKWLANCPKPNLHIMHPHYQEILKYELPIISPVFVEHLIPEDSKPWLKDELTDTGSWSPQQSSGISSNSSCLSYANTEPADIIAGVQDALGKAFPSISPISALTTNLLRESNKDEGLLSAPTNLCGVRTDDMSSGSSGFDNKTYSLLIPSCPSHILTGSSEVQTQTEMVCDSAYCPSGGEVVTCPDQQVPACPHLNLPQVVSSLMPTDMSYQQCNADSESFSHAEASSLSSISSGTDTTAPCDPVSRVDAAVESFNEVVSGPEKPNGKREEAIICDDNPCYGCVPAGSGSFPPVDKDYQPFENLLGKPDVLFPEEGSGEKEEYLEKYSAESFTNIPSMIPGLINIVQGSQCPSELQRPFLPLISTDRPVSLITDSGYQSV